MKDSWIVALLTVLGLGFMLAIIWEQREYSLTGKNDFAHLYNCALLVDGDDLYNQERFYELSVETTGAYSKNQGCTRPPYHYAMLWPLRWFSYLAAYGLWQFVSVMACIGFLVLWRPPDAALTVLYFCFSLPIFAALMNGQDNPLLLFVIAATMALHRRGREFLAGAVFSLCAAKFHLFLLTPILILGQRNWRFGRGFLAGAGVLVAASFAVAGWSWPLAYYEAVSNPVYTPNFGLMPNLHGAASGLVGSTAWEIALGASTIAAAWIVSRRANFEYAFACCLLGGLLLSYHSYLHDAATLLPALLTIVSGERPPMLKFAAYVLLFPLTYFCVVFGWPYSSFVVVIMLAIVYLMAYGVLREPAEQQALEPALTRA